MDTRHRSPTHGRPAAGGTVGRVAGRARALRRAAVVVSVLAPAVLAGPAPGAAQDPDPVGTWPLVPEPEVVAPFDPPAGPYGPGHRGVDLLGAPGRTVHAALPGRVSYAGPLAGIGVVVVDHGATRTTYQPVTASVSVGDQVAGGGPLGALALTGSHCFPRACLHWGWIEGASTYLDPLRLVGAGPVRLLPLWSEEPVGPAPGGAGAPQPARPALLHRVRPPSLVDLFD